MASQFEGFEDEPFTGFEDPDVDDSAAEEVEILAGIDELAARRAAAQRDGISNRTRGAADSEGNTGQTSTQSESTATGNGSSSSDDAQPMALQGETEYRWAQDPPQYEDVPIRERMTDDANGLLFAQTFQGLVCYAPDVKYWLIWGENRWEKRADDQVTEYCKSLARSLLDREYIECASRSDLSQPWVRHALKTRAVRGIQGMLKMASSDPRIRLNLSEFDQCSYLMTTQTGTANLQTGQLQEPSPDDHITKITGGGYDPDADMTSWLDFIRWAMSNDAAKLRYLEDIIGQTLHGEVAHEELYIHHGEDGQNGKTTFQESLAAALGEYAVVADDRLLNPPNSYSHNTWIARLRGARYVYGDETKVHSTIDEAETKRITGGSTLRGREPFEGAIDFEPTHTLHFAWNQLNAVRDSSESMWRRIKLLPWVNRISDEDKDPDLRRRFKEEYCDAIVTWAIDCAIQYYKSGQTINEPQCVKDATRQYQKREDLLGQFIEETVSKAPNCFITQSQAVTAYQMFADGLRLNRKDLPVAPRMILDALAGRLKTIAEVHPIGTDRSKKILGYRISAGPTTGEPRTIGM